MADIHYYRILRTAQGGVCGEMIVKDVSFFAMENLKPGTKYASIPPGRYKIKLVKLGERSEGKKGLCFRFTEIPGRDGTSRPFLIHRAYKNDWRTLAGCIAPGKPSDDKEYGQNTELKDSITTIDKIINLLGGPAQLHKTFTISIENVAPGQADHSTKRQFINKRLKLAKKNKT